MVFLYIFLSVAALLLIICLVSGAIGFKIACVSQRVKKPETDPKRILRAEIRKKNNEYMLSHPHEDLEMKTPDGKQSDSQKEFEKLATKYKYLYCVVRDLPIFQQLMMWYIEDKGEKPICL
jgi:hypothetical protein